MTADRRRTNAPVYDSVAVRATSSAAELTGNRNEQKECEVESVCRRRKSLASEVGLRCGTSPSPFERVQAADKADETECKWRCAKVSSRDHRDRNCP